MKLVIEIPKEAYELLQKDGVDWLGAEHILDAVSKGTPLPEHHGDLKDVDEILAHKMKCISLFEPDVGGHYSVTQKDIEAALTIIPATNEPTRTMLDCYKCKNNKAGISCEGCHFEPKEHDCEHCANAKDYSEDGFYCKANEMYCRVDVSCEKFKPITDEWVEDLEQ